MDHRKPVIEGRRADFHMRETFHIEVIGPLPEGARVSPQDVQQRILVRSATVDAAKERALRLFARARVPQRSGNPAEAVRVLDGAGTEVFRWSRFDESGG